MALFENFPYTNLHNLNLDWIVKTILQLKDEVERIGSGKIVVADPIQWDISKQYEQFTIVMDNNNAYLSIQPVPLGIQISNTDYWSKIFDLSQIFDDLKDAISFNDDGNSTTSSVNRSTGSLVWLNDKLHIVLTDINQGADYTESNVAETSIEEIISNIAQQITTLANNTSAHFLTLENTVADKISNRLKGKKIAIYGDSWTTPTWGTPWINRLQTLSQAAEVHAIGIPSASLAQILSGGWDSYNADIYIIEGGLNDVGLNTGATDFMDAISDFVAAIKLVNPAAEIYFIAPPRIDRNDFLYKRLPPEFYRTCYWRLAPRYKYHVINGLKWTDVVYADGVHPTAASAPIIGDYIFESLQNFGDGETHTKEYCTMTRQTTDILFEMEGGLPFLVFQQTVFSPLASDGSCGIFLDIGYTMNNAQATCFGKGNDGSKNQPCMMVTGTYGANNLVMLCPALGGSTATSFTVFQSARLNLIIAAWNMPVVGS